MLLDDSRAALLDVLNNELTKLRQLSAGTDLLGEAERKCLETYARIVKLLEKAPREADEERTWSASEIEQELGAGAKSL